MLNSRWSIAAYLNVLVALRAQKESIDSVGNKVGVFERKKKLKIIRTGFQQNNLLRLGDGHGFADGFSEYASARLFGFN